MMIRTAIAGGWLDADELAERRARLVDALVKLALDPASPTRESLQAGRLLAVSITAANLRILDRSLPRRGKPRRSRMGISLQGEGGPPCGPTGRSRPTGPDRPTARNPLPCPRRRAKGTCRGRAKGTCRERRRPTAEEEGTFEPDCVIVVADDGLEAGTARAT
jgi:hypothetical protein